MTFNSGIVRKDFNTVDHLFSLAQLYEKSKEHQLGLWITALDFSKAFDTIEHDALWIALLDQGFQPAYIRLLRKLYKEHSGRTRLDRLSTPFTISRGSKQGDPLSSLLFNAVLESVFAKIKDG